ncbi:copia protein [Tanacetum coccineum]
MTGNRKLFSTYKAYNGSNVIFGSNLRGNIIGKGYSQNSKAYIILNKHTRKVEESLNVTFSETPPPSKTLPLVDDDLDEEEGIKVTEKKNLEKPKNVNEALGDESWIVAMQEELNQFIANNVWELVPQPRNMTIIGTKWVFRNKLDENGVVSRNKARLVTCQDMCDEFAKIMHDEFEMSMMGELNFFLGLQIKQMEDGIFFNQSKYIKEMLKKFGLEDSKPMKTPMSSDTKLTKDEECESVDSTEYRGMIGSLLYLTASRPDIMFSTCLCARFQEAPKTSHLEAVKRIFRYIKGTTHLGLWYPKGTGIETVVYADSDHAGDYVDRKSTSGICTFVGCCLTSWFSKKQTALAISTTEAEYVSAGKACQQALWMKQALIDYDVRLDDVPIMCDNKGVIDLSKNPVQHSRTKHIEIRHHFLRDNVQKGHISIKKVPSIDNIADILTKPFKRKFQYRLSYSDEGQMFMEFVIQNQIFSYSREEFAQILDIPCEGTCVFTNRWSLNELVYGAPSEDLYQTNLSSPDDIISYIREDREGQVTRIRHQEEVEVQDYQILTREIVSTLKPLEEIIRENVFCLGGNRDHVPACLCYMLYCVANSEKFNLAYYMAKRMEWVTKQARLILPYGMLLTRLFKFIFDENPELQNESYVLYDRVMNPLAAQLERKPRKDRGTRRGRHSTSSSSAFDQPSSSHLNDDDDGNGEGTSRASTPSPIRYVNSLTNQVPQVFQNPPNIDPHLEPFYTRQTEIINRQV